MKILSQRVFDFQGFRDSQQVCYESGINIIVGQNNSGKSSLLASLRAPLADDRHRDSARYKTHQLPAPSVSVSISVSGMELKEAILRRGQPIDVPVQAGREVHNYAQAAPFLNDVFIRQQVIFDLERFANSSFATRNYPSHGIFMPSDRDVRRAVRINVSNGSLGWGGLLPQAADGFPTLLDWIWQQSVFFFDAERYRIGRSGQIYASRLNSDASNLPSVLLSMSGERGSLFQKLVSHMREIFPTFGNLSVRPCRDAVNMIEVMVWPTVEMLTPELSIPLATSGTGISQTLGEYDVCAPRQPEVALAKEAVCRVADDRDGNLRRACDDA